MNSATRRSPIRTVDGSTVAAVVSRAVGDAGGEALLSACLSSAIVACSSVGSNSVLLLSYRAVEVSVEVVAVDNDTLDDDDDDFSEKACAQDDADNAITAIFRIFIFDISCLVLVLRASYPTGFACMYVYANTWIDLRVFRLIAALICWLQVTKLV